MEVELETSLERHEYLTRRERLGHLIDQINPDGTMFRVSGHRIGWQNLSGEGELTISEPRDLLQKLTPDGVAWRLTAEQDRSEDALHITVYHHDSPVDGEAYLLTPQRPLPGTNPRSHFYTKLMYVNTGSEVVQTHD